MRPVSLHVCTAATPGLMCLHHGKMWLAVVCVASLPSIGYVCSSNGSWLHSSAWPTSDLLESRMRPHQHATYSIPALHMVCARWFQCAQHMRGVISAQSACWQLQVCGRRWRPAYVTSVGSSCCLCSRPFSAQHAACTRCRNWANS
jgi:hypothetical protein